MSPVAAGHFTVPVHVGSGSDAHAVALLVDTGSADLVISQFPRVLGPNATRGGQREPGNVTLLVDQSRISFRDVVRVEKQVCLAL